MCNIIHVYVGVISAALNILNIIIILCCDKLCVFSADESHINKLETATAVVIIAIQGSLAEWSVHTMTFMGSKKHCGVWMSGGLIL